MFQKKLILFIAAALFSSNAFAAHPINCVPGQNFTSTIGAAFACVPSRDGMGAWKDAAGVAWTVKIGRFQNQADSEASGACAKIGAMLPTYDDYARLANYFERDAKGWLTEKGLADMHWLFRDMHGANAGNWAVYWTASVVEGYPHLALTFNGNRGTVSAYNRIYGLAVRCVTR